jgi:hypothetical protein
MEDKVRFVLQGFENLSELQKTEVMRILDRRKILGRLDEEVRKDLRVGMGPLGGVCPCCGR